MTHQLLDSGPKKFHNTGPMPLLSAMAEKETNDLSLQEPCLRISRILHAGYIFEYLGVKIAFDPIFENPFSENCFAFPNVKFEKEQIRRLKLDAVFISHFHDDHCSLESLDLLDRQTPLYVYCVHDELFSMLRELGFSQVHNLKLNFPISIGELQVIPRPALDFDVDSIFHIRAGSLNVLNVVDSWIEPSTLKVLSRNAPWDLILWPFQTMREIEVLSPVSAQTSPIALPEEWFDQLKVLCPRYIVPSSCQFIHEDWSWYNHALFPITYRQFKKEIEAKVAHSQILRLNPSTSILLDKKSFTITEPLTWVIPVGNQNVDYEYNSRIRIPSTAEVSKNFAALTAKQRKDVFQYCDENLAQKYNDLDQSEEIYFQKKMLWELSLYDEKGEPIFRYYQFQDGKIQTRQKENCSIGWRTEIPLVKLYAALNFGEALTSLYVRINDVKFSPQIEEEIRSVDVCEDPLIRVLFTGAFGAYQREQLTRLGQKSNSSSGPTG